MPWRLLGHVYPGWSVVNDFLVTRWRKPLHQGWQPLATAGGAPRGSCMYGVSEAPLPREPRISVAICLLVRERRGRRLGWWKVRVWS